MRLPAVSLAASFLLLLAPAAGSAAQAGSSQDVVKPAAPQRTWVLGQADLEAVARASALACPVSLDVRHGWGVSKYVATGESVMRPDTQALDVTVSNRGWAEMASLDVIVQMRPSKAGLLPLVTGEDARGERLRLHFDLRVKVNHDADASWSVPGSQTVAYVELSKVTYRDGSVWSGADGGNCRFTPNPLMLISAR